MSVLSLHDFTATPKAFIKTIVLSTAVVTSLVMTGCASKPQVSGMTRYAKAPDFYTVRSGDTLSSIAVRYGLNYITVAQMNDIAPPYRIYVGQSIRLKNTPTPTTSTQAMTQTAPIQRQSIAIPSTPAPVTPSTVTSVAQTKSLPSTPSTTVKAPATVIPTTKVVTQVSGLNWVKPTQNSILSPFDLAKNVKGIRYSAKVGDPVYAAANGQVVYAADGLKEFGNLVLIKHINGYVTAYAHNSKMLVNSGQNVVSGQKIAEMGATGASNPMLEFQIRLNGKPIDPATVLPNR